MESKKTKYMNKQNGKRVIDTENRQVVARWEVCGQRREIAEGD